MKHRYRGYMILYHAADSWLAFIYPPGVIEATGDTVQATSAEGEAVLLQRVQARIDAELDGEKKTPH